MIWRVNANYRKSGVDTVKNLPPSELQAAFTDRLFFLKTVDKTGKITGRHGEVGGLDNASITKPVAAGRPNNNAQLVVIKAGLTTVA